MLPNTSLSPESPALLLISGFRPARRINGASAGRGGGGRSGAPPPGPRLLLLFSRRFKAPYLGPPLLGHFVGRARRVTRFPEARNAII